MHIYCTCLRLNKHIRSRIYTLQLNSCVQFITTHRLTNTHIAYVLTLGSSKVTDRWCLGTASPYGLRLPQKYLSTLLLITFDPCYIAAGTDERWRGKKKTTDKKHVVKAKQTWWCTVRSRLADQNILIWRKGLEKGNLNKPQVYLTCFFYVWLKNMHHIKFIVWFICNGVIQIVWKFYAT